MLTLVGASPAALTSTSSHICPATREVFEHSGNITLRIRDFLLVLKVIS